MSASSSVPGSHRRSRKPRTLVWQPWLESLALFSWGALFLKYWLLGRMYLLIHPNYLWLTVVAGFALVGLSGLRIVTLVWRASTRKKPIDRPADQSHLTLLPPSWSSFLLLGTAILGLLIEPRAFASQTAIQRGITDAALMTRTRPQSFRSVTRPEERSIIDWVRTLNVYPEPDAYQGQPVKVQGFVLHPKDSQFPPDYFLISRFVITCCAADVYPVGLPVKPNPKLLTPTADTWLEIQGKMGTETFAGERRLVIQPERFTQIPEPKNPYDY